MRLVGYPCRNVKSCNGHGPGFPQAGQSGGWLTGSSLWWEQNTGISMPTSLAASTTSVPAGTAILWPSMVTFTSGMRQRRPDVARVSQGVVLVLLAEVPEG